MSTRTERQQEWLSIRSSLMYPRDEAAIDSKSWLRPANVVPDGGVGDGGEVFKANGIEIEADGRDGIEQGREGSAAIQRVEILDGGRIALDIDEVRLVVSVVRC